MKRKKNKHQHVFIHCPKCRTELIENHSFVEERLYYTYFGCSNCGTESMWDLGPPIPILLSSYEKEVDNMANAKKCDRCGEYYEEKDVKFRLFEMTYAGLLAGQNDIDLCPHCSDMFKIFMNNVKKEVRPEEKGE